MFHLPKDSPFAIEKGIPIPEQNYSGKRGKPHYPFAEMEVGDSFWSPRATVRTAAFAFGARQDRSYVTREVDGGYRVWRTR